MVCRISRDTYQNEIATRRLSRIKRGIKQHIKCSEQMIKWHGMDKRFSGSLLIKGEDGDSAGGNSKHQPKVSYISRIDHAIQLELLFPCHSIVPFDCSLLQSMSPFILTRQFSSQLFPIASSIE